MATIRIQRTKDSNMSGKYKIFIDGEMSGTIAYKEVKEFTTSAGQHTVTVNTGWLEGSPDIIVGTSDDKTCTLMVSRSNIWMWILILPFLTVLSNSLTTGCLRIVLMSLPFLLYLVYYCIRGRKRVLKLEKIE
jgi:hypothetical protein